jgi:hypothetical protein
VYVAGPLAGALIAVGCAMILRGRGGDSTSRAAGSGRLGRGALASEARKLPEFEAGKGDPDAAAADDQQ